MRAREREKFLEIVKEPARMQAYADAVRREGRTIAFVPTMGFLHDGHLALVRRARELGQVVVVSIFVNPTQFAPTEDLAAYPRDFDRDRMLVEREGADVIFYPDAHDMYEPGKQTEVRVTDLSGPLCGASRPTHFAGVALVCCKLFNIVKPHYAIFGQKDYQQYLVVDRMVRDLSMDVEIVPHPIVREADGLAMSSRNVYLSKEERAQAVALSRALARAEELVERGQHDAAAILDEVREALAEAPLGTIDYAELRSVPDLKEIEGPLAGPTLLALAVRFGKARLIDNTVLHPEAE